VKIVVLDLGFIKLVADRVFGRRNKYFALLF